MPQTVPYAFEYETPEETPNPGRTLSGGPSGTSPILAEQVNDELSRLETTVVGGIDSRVTALEAVPTPPSWVAISSGSESSVSTFVIPSIPTSTYSRVRLTLYGEASTASDPIRVRFNGDSTAAMHRSGIVVWDSDGNILGTIGGFADGTFWNIAQWGTGNGCTAVVEIFRTDVTEACSFMANGLRVGGSAGAHTFSRSWGRLNEVRLLDSLRVSGPTGGTLSCSWWLEGAPA